MSLQVAPGPQLLPGATRRCGRSCTPWLSLPRRARSRDQGCARRDSSCPHIRAHSTTQQGTPPPSTPHPHPPTPDLARPATFQRLPSPPGTADASDRLPARNTLVRLSPRDSTPPGSNPPWRCHASLLHMHLTHSGLRVHMRARSRAHIHAHSRTLTYVCTHVHTIYTHTRTCMLMQCSYANSHVYVRPRTHTYVLVHRQQPSESTTVWISFPLTAPPAVVTTGPFPSPAPGGHTLQGLHPGAPMGAPCQGSCLARATGVGTCCGSWTITPCRPWGQRSQGHPSKITGAAATFPWSPRPQAQSRSLRSMQTASSNQRWVRVTESSLCSHGSAQARTPHRG